MRSQGQALRRIGIPLLRGPTAGVAGQRATALAARAGARTDSQGLARPAWCPSLGLWRSRLRGLGPCLFGARCAAASRRSARSLRGRCGPAAMGSSARHRPPGRRLVRTTPSPGDPSASSVVSAGPARRPRPESADDRAVSACAVDRISRSPRDGRSSAAGARRWGSGVEASGAAPERSAALRWTTAPGRVKA